MTFGSGPLLERVRPQVFDPLLLLVLAQLFFVVLGITTLGFDISWSHAAGAVAAAVFTELGGAALMWKFRGGQGAVPFLPLSAIAAALGIIIFFRATSPWFFVAAGALAIASKYVIRLRRGHIFNPSNFAVVTLVFFAPHAATIEFTQWGDSLWVYALIACICFFVAYRAGVWVTTLSFLVAYAAGLLALLPVLPEEISAHHYGLIGPSLVLFASFMITDPRTAPGGFYPRILQGAGVALLYFSLEILGVRYALFVASFLMTALNLLSRLLYDLRPLRPSSASPVRNAYAFALCAALFLILSVPVLREQAPYFAAERISPRFVAMGIEGGQLLRCAPGPAFVPAGGVGLDTSSDYTHGVAWGDYDGDGDDDLFISSLNKPSRLYRNTGGFFTDVTQDTGLPETSSASAFFVDYDNDGRLDLFVVAPQKAPVSPSGSLGTLLREFIRKKERPALPAVYAYHNAGNSFSDVTKALRLDSVLLPHGGAGTMTVADYDDDGYLDFVLADRGLSMSINSALGNSAVEKSLFDPFFDSWPVLSCRGSDVREWLSPYVGKGVLSQDDVDFFVAEGGCVSLRRRIPFTRNDSESAADGSTASAELVLRFPGNARLFENANGKYFTEHSDFAGLARARLAQEPVDVRTSESFDAISGRFYQPISFDYDADGRMDVFLAVDTGTNVLLRNEGGFRFGDQTSTIQYAGSGMGVDIADLDRNGYLDVFVTNTRQDYLFSNKGEGAFSRPDGAIGRLGVGWGVSFLDYDLDGWEDLLVANGDIQTTSDVPFGAVGKAFFRADLLYRNDGTGTLHDATWDDLCPSFQSGFSLAVSDYDNDGDQDVFVGNIGQAGIRSASRNDFFVNQTDGKSFLKVQLRGTTSNYFGVGALVAVSDRASLPQTKQVTLGSSFYSQSSLTLVFGLAERMEPVDVDVRWPSGKESRISGVSPNQTLVIREP